MTNSDGEGDTRGGSGSRISNAVTGDVSGSVQAGVIHGGVHVHNVAPGAIGIVPRQLRPVPAHFTGRVMELAELDRIVDRRKGDGPALVVISGPGGVGKSALALRWLHGNVDRYPDGQLSVDLGSDGASLSTVLGCFLRALGVPAERVPVDVGEAAALFRSVTAEKRVAVLIDNAMSAAQVRTLLPASPSSVVVVTTRWRLGGLAMDGAGFLTAVPLDRQAGSELLARTVGDARAAREPDAVATLVDLCGGLPIALSIVGARLVMRPRWLMARVVRDLTDEQRRLSGLAVEQDMSVHGVFDLSYEALPPQVSRAYRSLGLHPGPFFGVELAAAVLDVPGEHAEELLETLVDASLLDAEETNLYRFHDLLRLHARQCAEREDPPADRIAVVRRILRYYLSAAAAVDQVVMPLEWRLGFVGEPGGYATSAEALDSLEPELQNLMAVLRAGAEYGFDELVWQLCEAMWSLFLLRKHFPDWIAAHQLAIEAAGRCGNLAAKARMHFHLGLAFHNLNRPVDAVRHGMAALDAARAAGHERAESEALNLVGMANRARGRHAEAIDVLRQAIELDCRTGQLRDEALSRRRLGQTLTAAGRIEEAIAELRRARERAAELTDVHIGAITTVWLAEALTRGGRAAEAVDLLPSVWSTMRESGSKQYHAQVLMVWGEAAAQLGDLETARDRLTRARDLYAEIGVPHEARVRAALSALEARDAG